MSILADFKIRVVRGARVSGRLTDKSGAPAAGTRVELRRADLISEPDTLMEVLRRQARRNSRWGFTDAEGAWSIPNVLSGRYRAVPTHRDLVEWTSEEFTCPASGEVCVPDHALTRGAVISGRVLDPDGTSDPQATVMIRARPFDSGDYCQSFPTDAAAWWAEHGDTAVFDRAKTKHGGAGGSETTLLLKTSLSDGVGP